ncbi:MAG: non-homologous end-joining DNA ligase [Chloroflexota bacterium]
MPKEYEAKREFARTPEPPPAQPLEGTGPLIFVVQKHAARRLHYDFRLEVDGVLKSWSVPAGPSLDPQVKRLAVMVEDHPIDYASFEGNIAKGEYGAGQVIVWDYGDYFPDEKGKLSSDNRAEAQDRMRKALTEGKISVNLRGHKLKGSWTMVKMKGQQNNWLLIKHRDNFADSRDILKEEASVLSGLTIEDLKAGSQPSRSFDKSEKVKLPETSGAKKAPFPQKVLPMLAGSAETPFSNPDWLFEPKLDGYRIIAEIKDSNVRLLSRRGLDVTQKYDIIRESLRPQSATQLVLDGEIVALDEKGKLCFQCLQNYLESVGRAKAHSEEAPPIIYYVFDILYLDGYELQAIPLTVRKKILERILVASASVRLMEHFEGDGTAIYRGAIDQGLEGIIAKRKDSKYEAGRRSSSWLKIKSTTTDDFIIGGYTQGEGNRARTFGALVLGFYDDKKRLIPAGHVGTGLNDKLLADLKKRLDAIKTKQNPFSVMPDINAPVTWVRPELVAEIKFAEADP